MAAQKQALGLSLPLQLGQNGYFATNTDSISQISDNIKNMLLTRPGERRFNNSFGSNLYNLLFQGIDSEISKDVIINAVQNDVDRFLNKSIEIVNVSLSNNQPENNIENSIFISITFKVKNTVGTTNLFLTDNRI